MANIVVTLPDEELEHIATALQSELLTLIVRTGQDWTELTHQQIIRRCFIIWLKHRVHSYDEELASQTARNAIVDVGIT